MEVDFDGGKVMTSRALAVIGEELVLPDIRDVQTRVLALVDSGAVEELDEARRRAEALKLYEQRAGHEDRKQHYFRLQVLTEAALGILSFDDPDVIAGPGLRANWRLLASALERGKLMDLMQKHPDCTGPQLAYTIQNMGFAWVKYSDLGDDVGSATKRRGGRGDLLAYKVARKVALERGVDLHGLTAPTEVVKKMARNSAERSERMHRTHRAAKRLRRMERRKELVEAGKMVGPNAHKTAAFLKQTLQAAHEMQTELPPRKEMHPDERRAFDDLFSYLHQAEDAAAVVLGLVHGNRL